MAKSSTWAAAADFAKIDGSHLGTPPGRGRPLTSAHEALRSAFRDMGLTDQARRLAVIAVWEQVVGAEIAARTEPTAFARGVLSVRVGSAAWQQELALLAPRLIEGLNAELGAPVVKALRVLAGRVHKESHEAKPPWLEAPASDADLEIATEASRPIADPEVRAAFARLVLLEQKRRRLGPG